MHKIIMIHASHVDSWTCHVPADHDLENKESDLICRGLSTKPSVTRSTPRRSSRDHSYKMPSKNYVHRCLHWLYIYIYMEIYKSEGKKTKIKTKIKFKRKYSRKGGLKGSDDQE